MTKKAFITGVTGQDGSYLAELLLHKGYEVHGLKRRASSFNTSRVDHLPELKLHYGDMTDGSNLTRLLQDIRPHEVYNLAAQSHVQVSFETPEYTANADGLGAMRLLEGIRVLGMEDDVKLYQASTSELYGNSLFNHPEDASLSETTPFEPRSPYGVAKLYAYWITVNYREAYGMHASNGILFNHESPRRGATFVTKKITRAVAAIHQGRQDHLKLGNINAKRDWGHAKDYVEAMWLALQQDQPGDYVVATGMMYSVRDFVEEAFSLIGHPIVWSGEGVNEIGISGLTGRTLVSIDPHYFRPADVEMLRGDATKARDVLGWKPRIGFSALVKEMVSADLKEGKSYGDQL